MLIRQLQQRIEKSLILRKWRRYSSEQLVGLDIGPASVKLLRINPEVNPYKIEGFAIAPLPSGAIIKDEIKNPDALSAALKAVFDESGVKIKNIAIAIPRSSTIIKTITIDSRLSVADIESRAWVEANHHFPDLVGDIYLDFAIVGPSAEAPSQLDLLLVACRKDHVNPYLDILRASGLNAAIVDVNCYALERALFLILKRSPQLQTAALLNLDFNLSSLIVVHDKQLIYAHDHSYEGLNFENQATQYLKDGSEAKGSLADAAYVEILKTGISAHLRHTMHFFFSSRPHIAIQQIILSGDCATIPYLNQFIKQETGIETIVADPLVDVAVASYIDEKKLHQAAPALMLCCGLGLSALGNV